MKDAGSSAAKRTGVPVGGLHGSEESDGSDTEGRGDGRDDQLVRKSPLLVKGRHPVGPDDSDKLVLGAIDDMAPQRTRGQQQAEQQNEAEARHLRVVAQTGSVPTVERLEHGREAYGQEEQQRPELEDLLH